MKYSVMQRVFTVETCIRDHTKVSQPIDKPVPGVLVPFRVHVHKVSVVTVQFSNWFCESEQWFSQLTVNIFYS